STATIAPTTTPMSLHDALPIFLLFGQLLQLRVEIGDRQIQLGLADFQVSDLSDDGIFLRKCTGTEGDRGSQGRRGEEFMAQHQRSEEHTSELQSRENIVCRLML